MDITFITALHNIEIKGDLGRGDKIDDLTFISNDKYLVKKMIPSEAIKSLGTLEYNVLINSQTFIYSHAILPDHMNPEEYLVDRLFFVQSFLSSVWLKIDNNINYELGFVFYKINKMLGVSSNFLTISCTSANLEHNKTLLSRESLKEIRSLYREKFHYIENSYSYKKETQLLKSASRFSMALFHIQGARQESDLTIKISNYCSALESLFSTNQAELAHQLSERLAFFISNNPEDRLINYKKSKKSYAIRSKGVHGSYIKENQIQEAKKLSIFCDSSLRIILNKILKDDELQTIFSSNNEAIDAYMLDLIFGK